MGLLKVVAESDEPCVRAYDPQGGRRRNYTRSQAEFLAGRKAVVAQRSRKGEIVSIHFYLDTPMPLQNRLKAGTRYCFEHRHGVGKVWELVPLPYQAADAAGGYVEQPEVIDRRIRAIFQATAISIFAVNPSVKAKVVSITAGRSKKPARLILGEVAVAA